MEEVKANDNAHLWAYYRNLIWDAFWGILGMLTGAAIYAEVYPTMKQTVLTWGNYGKITLPQVLGINHWFIIPVFVIGGLVLFRWFEKKGL